MAQTKQLLLRLPENRYKDLKIRTIQEGKQVSQLALECFQEKAERIFKHLDALKK